MRELTASEKKHISGGESIFVKFGRWIASMTCECNQTPNSFERLSDFNSTRGRL